jgi:hypothetical protein
MIIWPNPLLAVNPIAYQQHVMARGISTYSAAGGAGPTPTPGANFSIAEPAIVGITSGIADNASTINVVSPTGEAGDLIMAVLTSDGNKAAYMSVPPEQITEGWGKHAGRVGGSVVADSVWYLIAPSGQAQYVEFNTIRISGVDQNNPINNDDRWFAERITYSGVVDRWAASANIEGYYTHARPIQKRNTLSICVQSWDQLRTPDPSAPDNGWTPVANVYANDLTHGCSQIISYKSYGGGSCNWEPNQKFDEGESLADTNLVGQFHINPSGDFVRPVMVADYPEINYMNESGSYVNSAWKHIEFPSGLQQGEILYTFIIGDGGPRYSKMWDNTGFHRYEGTVNNLSSNQVQVWSKACQGGEDGYYRYSNGSSETFQVVQIVASGGDLSERLNASGLWNTGTATTTDKVQYPELTTTKDNCRIFSLVQMDAAATVWYNQADKHLQMPHASESGIFCKPIVTTAFAMYSTVQDAAGLVPSGTWESRAVNKASAMRFAVPPATGAVSQVPYIAASSVLNIRTPNGSLTGTMPTGTDWQEGDIFLLLVGSQSSAEYADAYITSDNYGWRLIGYSEGTSNTNIGAYMRKANPGETAGSFTLALSDTHVGIVYTIRGAEGPGHCVQFQNNGAVTSSGTIPALNVTHDNSLVFHVASLGDGAKNITGWDDGSLSGLLNNVKSGAATFNSCLSIAQEARNAGYADPQSFSVDSADEALAGMSIAFKPLVASALNNGSGVINTSMPYVVGDASGSIASSAFIDIVTPTETQVGDLLFAACHFDNFSSLPMVSYGAESGWTQIGDNEETIPGTFLAWKIAEENDVAGGQSYRFLSGATAARLGAITAVRGANQNDPVGRLRYMPDLTNKLASQDPNSTTTRMYGRTAFISRPGVPAINTQYDNSLVMAWGAMGGNQQGSLTQQPKYYKLGYQMNYTSNQAAEMYHYPMPEIGTCPAAEFRTAVTDSWAAVQLVVNPETKYTATQPSGRPYIFDYWTRYYYGSATFTAQVPSGIQAGDLLVFTNSLSFNGTSLTPSISDDVDGTNGWERKIYKVSTVVTYAVWTKRATGTETLITYDTGTGSSDTHQAACYGVRNATSGVLAGASGVTEYTASVNTLNGPALPSNEDGTLAIHWLTAYGSPNNNICGGWDGGPGTQDASGLWVMASDGSADGHASAMGQTENITGSGIDGPTWVTASSAGLSAIGFSIW